MPDYISLHRPQQFLNSSPIPRRVQARTANKKPAPKQRGSSFARTAPLFRQIIDFGHCTHDAIGFVSDSAHRVIEQSPDDVRCDIQLSELCTERPSQIMVRPLLDTITEIFLPLAKPGDWSVIRCGRWKQKIGTVTDRNFQRWLSPPVILSCAILRAALGGLRDHADGMVWTLLFNRSLRSMQVHQR